MSSSIHDPQESSIGSPAYIGTMLTDFSVSAIPTIFSDFICSPTLPYFDVHLWDSFSFKIVTASLLSPQVRLLIISDCTFSPSILYLLQRSVSNSSSVSFIGIISSSIHKPHESFIGRPAKTGLSFFCGISWVSNKFVILGGSCLVWWYSETSPILES